MFTLTLCNLTHPVFLRSRCKQWEPVIVISTVYRNAGMQIHSFLYVIVVMFIKSPLKAIHFMKLCLYQILIYPFILPMVTTPPLVGGFLLPDSVSLHLKHTVIHPTILSVQIIISKLSFHFLSKNFKTWLNMKHNTNFYKHALVEKTTDRFPYATLK